MNASFIDVIPSVRFLMGRGIMIIILNVDVILNELLRKLRK